MTKKKIKTSDILGDNYYIYELTSSNYTPALNDTITITCTMKDVYGTAASGKSITLYQNGTSKGTQTTNNNGVATWSVTCSTAGLQKFNIKDTSIELFVDNKSDIDHTHSNYVTTSDSRLSDARTPTSHTHGSITNDGKITSSTTMASNSQYVVYADTNGAIKRADTMPAAYLRDPAAHSQIGNSAGDSQYTINGKINTALAGKADLDHTHSQYLTSHQSLDSKTVTVEKQSSAESGYAHTYVVKQNGSQVGVKINIPKDFLVKSATVKTVTTVNNPVSGYVVGDKYLDFVVNSKDNSATDEHLYVLVSDLVDTEIEWNNIQNKPTLFSGSYADLTNKPSYTPTITSNTNGAYKIGSINISGSNVDIYGKDTDTHQDISGKENISNKTSSWNATTNHTRYPTEKLVKDSLDLKANSSDLSTVATTGDYDDLLNTPEELCIVDFYYDSTTDELVLNTCSDQDLANITDKEDKSNKVATWSTTPNHIHYPTEKLVKDYIDDMIGDIIDYIEG